MKDISPDYKPLSLSLLQAHQIPEQFRWCKAQPENQQDYDELINSHWPRYLTEPSDIEFPDFFNRKEKDIYQKRHNLIGIRESKTNQLIACLSSIQIAAPIDSLAYPDEGWLWAYRTAHNPGFVNTLVLQQATVHKDWRGDKLADSMIKATKHFANNNGFSQILVPLRPVAKVHYPELNFAEFIEQVINNEIKEPWIELHLKNGAKILNMCNQSVVVRASINWWQERTNQIFQSSRTYQIEQGVVPLELDLEKRLGIYCEPNIWMKYALR